MSVGGKVVQTYLREDGKLWVNTIDAKDYCAIFVDGEHDIQVGTDTLWWQMGTAYWSRRDKDGVVFQDEQIKKQGGSGVSHPLGPEYEVRYDFYPAFKKAKQERDEWKNKYQELDSHIKSCLV